MTSALDLPRAGRFRAPLRALAASACLLAQLLSPAPLTSGVTIFVAAFLAYSLAALLWKRLEELQSSLASLFLETAFFVAFSAYGANPGLWLAPALFLYLMFAATVQHEWGDVCIVVGTCLGFFAFVRPPDGGALWRVVVVAGVLACVLAWQKRQAERRLSRTLDKIEAFRHEAEKVRDAERQRIAGDFHDGPLQSFIGLQVRLDILGTLMKRDRAAAVEDLKELQQLARGQVAEIRSFLRSMRPAEVDSSDLAASARRIVEYFQKDTGLAARFVCSEPAVRVAPEISHEILQILREALHNVQKHSKAARLVVSMGRTGKTLELSVDDDGTGFPFSGAFTLDELDLLRLGPQSIKKRVRSLGGELMVESRPGHGAGLKMRFPG